MNKVYLFKIGIIIALVILISIFSYSLYVRVQYEIYGQSTFGKIISIKKIPQGSKSSFEIKSVFEIDNVRYYTDDSCLRYSFHKNIGDSIKVLYLKYNPKTSCHDCYFNAEYSLSHIMVIVLMILILILSLVYHEIIIIFLFK